MIVDIPVGWGEVVKGIFGVVIAWIAFRVQQIHRNGNSVATALAIIAAADKATIIELTRKLAEAEAKLNKV